ncbi:MAG: UvrD-helicase domain-containing protein [Gammaproteobacteria bacterium]
MSDQDARQAALNTSRSFIVQAPAGSGKTELLIQRYLALLAGVELPEQIIAITFTRKAAAEMRGRVLQALRAAGEGQPVTEPHRLKTRELATAALERAQELDWNLTEQPQRLRIDTLDALNVWLAQQLPILSGGVAGAQVVENARELYVQATRRVLEELGQTSKLGDSLQPLLRRLDNRYDRLEILLAELLPSRDQWLRYLASGSDADLRRKLESALERLIGEQLSGVAACLPDDVTTELVSLLRHGALSAAAPDVAARFAPWLDLSGLPAPTAQSLPAWQALPELLLVKSGAWRKQLTANMGFGAEHDSQRRRLRDLIAILQEQPELQQTLLSTRKLPAPHYEEAQWQTLAALRVVLRYLTAELRIVFAERNSVDFVELALAAQNALGESDAPSDLLLALDRRIQHILVDEFQDTSHTQLRLLKLLTAGWQEGDGRSLFLVGDPMQSIYRFRNADMSLFLKAKARGIGDVPCESLTLKKNFRSGPTVIGWINSIFPSVFPSDDELGAGAARFHPCEATRNDSAQAVVELHALRGIDPQAEVDRVIEILLDERRRYPDDSIAILVQSRSHLAGLHEQLRARRVNANAVELEAPNQRQVVQDLLGLTRALTHLSDRIAWLSVLRAPWCGLTWIDLHELVANDRDHPVWVLMNDPRRVERLSADGQRRLAFCRDILRLSFECRAQQPLARWIERTWVTLGGPACLDFGAELDHADRYFLRLGELDRRGDLDDPPALESSFSDPRDQSEPPAGTGIEIMTIHRAKGLEFDTVVLLGLGRTPPPEKGRGLYWLERLADDGREDLLLAPLTASANEPDELADFLKQIDRDRDLAERARLLYVATTRARDRLHLIGQLKPNAKHPDARSLLAFLWPRVQERFDEKATAVTNAIVTADSIRPVLRRLSDGFDSPLTPSSIVAAPPSPAQPSRPEFVWAGETALQIGVVVHNALQAMADSRLEVWDPDKIRDQSNALRGELRLLGVEDGDLAAATQRVIDALCRVIDDPTGRWLLQNHPQAASELPLTIHTATGLEHVRLDRTFVDDTDTRWIIDFKTSAHEGGATTEFLDSEVERYRPQLERYATAMAAIDDRPTRVGLYFPLLQAFRDWAP